MADESAPGHEHRDSATLPGYADPRPATPAWLVLLTWTGMGGFLGSWAVSFGTYLYHALTHSPALRDGQYAFIFFLTAPIGWCVGIVTACGLLYARGLDNEPPGWQVVVLVLGALLLAPCVALPLGMLAAFSIGGLVTHFPFKLR
jgi:hypothetical protein